MLEELGRLDPEMEMEIEEVDLDVYARSGGGKIERYTRDFEVLRIEKDKVVLG